MRIAIIPARGGSVRLPRKNILPFGNYPMIAWPIMAALDSKLFDRVIVSTEDAEIKRVALTYGAEVMDRPEELATGTTRVSQVCKHVVDEMKPDTFCCIYATTVFLKPHHLVESLTLLDGADGVMGVSLLQKAALQAMEEKNGFLTPIYKECFSEQSQQWPRIVASNGTLYWNRSSSNWLKTNFYVEKLRGYELETIDIDTPDEYEKAIKQLGQASPDPDH